MQLSRVTVGASMLWLFGCAEAVTAALQNVGANKLNLFLAACPPPCCCCCSYEHFYVVYCKFWELDSDHDFSLEKNDLARYNNCALTYQIVERIFEEVRGVCGLQGP